MAGKIRGKSKLTREPKKKREDEEQLNLIGTKKSSTLKAFRFYENDLQRLQEVAQKMNKVSHRHISETAVIRALLVLGAKSSDAKLIKALRDSI